jgi:hypothetical protein
MVPLDLDVDVEDEVEATAPAQFVALDDVLHCGQ